MDAITNPDIEQVTIMKSARVGYSKILESCHCISHTPRSMPNHGCATDYRRRNWLL